MRRAAVLVAALAWARPADACPAYTTCAFQPALGDNPDDAALGKLLEDGACDALGARAPNIPDIEVGLSRTKGPPQYATVMLKPIAATESLWQQFCNDATRQTLISFDCGFGIMQVTSGAASYGEKLSSDIAWNIGAGADILVRKWNAEYGGIIGDNDPFVVESWYYAVWAYNGFVYGNNPDNPEHPPNRPPFNGPGALSRRSYPYPDIVWGYLRYPMDWRTTPRWAAVEVTYPPPGLIGSSPDDLPRIEPEHRLPCGPPGPIDPEVPCGEGCPHEGIVDDLDPEFSLAGGGERVVGPGFRGELVRAPGRSAALTTATFAISVPVDGVYTIQLHVPATDFPVSSRAPYRMAGRGGALVGALDLAARPGFFRTIGALKLLAGRPWPLVLDDASGEPDRAVVFDAVRVVGGVAPTGAPGAACRDATECGGALVCDLGRCAAGCDDAPCDGVCEPLTGRCQRPAPDAGAPDAEPADLGGPGDAAPDAAEAGPSELPDAASPDAAPPDATAPPDAAELARPLRRAEVRGGCGCGATSSDDPALGLLLLALTAARRRRSPS